MQRLRRGLHAAIGYAAGLTLLSSCTEMYARLDDDATVRIAPPATCPEAMLTIGDSLPLAALMVSEYNASGLITRNDTLYRSRENPGKFSWSVRHSNKYLTEPGARITSRGVLTAQDRGVVLVQAHSAGKSSEELAITVIPRVTRLSIEPSSASLRVGDTLTFQADVALDGRAPTSQEFSWMLWENPVNDRRLQPRVLGPYIQSSNFQALSVVAARAGTIRFHPCLGGVRRDTVTVTVTGEPRIVDRNVPPLLLTAPSDTTVFVGETFSTYVHVLNAGLGNGPYTLRAAGEGLADTALQATGRRSGGGIEYFLLKEHRYYTAGTFPVDVTATDSAGRSSTLRTVYTAIEPVLSIIVNPDNSANVVRLSDESRYVMVAVLAVPGSPRLIASIIDGAPMDHEDPEPRARFGKTVYEQRTGREREHRDVNGDYEPDLILYFDKATLVRNGDLRLGTNEVRFTSGIRRPSRWVPGRQLAVPVFTPVSGMARFTVVR